MKHLILTISLILFANTVAATSLSIKHNKKLPTPYELITKGKILEKFTDKQGNPSYYIAWDKTDDFYECSLGFAYVGCVLMVQGTKAPEP